MNRRRVLGVGCAVVLAGLGAAGLVSWANSAKASTQDQHAQTAVVIVDRHVDKGADASVIAASVHVGTAEKQSLQPGALTSVAEIGAQVAAADLEKGDQLIAARLTTSVDSGLRPAPSSTASSSKPRPPSAVW